MMNSGRLQKELAFHTSNLVLAHIHLSTFMMEKNEAGIESFLETNFKDLQHRCLSLHKLLDELAVEDAALHRKIVRDGRKNTVVYNLFVSTLLVIGKGNPNKETLKHAQYTHFLGGCARLCLALPIDSFSMFGGDTAEFLQSRMKPFENAGLD